MKNVSEMTDNEIQDKMNILEGKYKKMKNLFIKVTDELDSLSKEYRELEEEMTKRNPN